MAFLYIGKCKSKAANRKHKQGYKLANNKRAFVYYWNIRTKLKKKNKQIF